MGLQEYGRQVFIDLLYIAGLKINYQSKVREVHEDAPNTDRSLKAVLKI